MIIGCRPPALFASYFPLASLAVDKSKQEVRGKQVSASFVCQSGSILFITGRLIELLAHQSTAFK